MDWLAAHATSVHGEMAVNSCWDLFEQGFNRCVNCMTCPGSHAHTNNGLSATLLRNCIIGALCASLDSVVHMTAQEVLQNLVFQHPMLTLLACTVEGLVRTDEPVARSLRGST